LLSDAGPCFAVRSRIWNGHVEHASMSAMAGSYAELIGARASSGACLLFGWSLGGLGAHAVAVELEQRGVEVGMVGIVDATFGGPASREADDRATAVGMAVHIFHPSPPGDAVLRRKLAEMPPPEGGFERLTDWCEEQGLLPRGATSAADLA